MPSYDVIVIGGGTNGLAAAGRLAKAGRRVLVAEAADRPGGGACMREFAPGYRVSGVAHLLNLLDPRVEAGLNLGAHGLAYAADRVATTALSSDGNHLVLHGAYGESLAGQIDEADKQAWYALRARLMRFAGALRPFKDMTPPRLAAGTGNDLIGLARLALKTRMLGRDDLREFLRLMLINVADVLDDELQDERLKGLIAFDTTLGAHLGPRSPNSLMLLYNRLAGEAAGGVAALALPKGGMGALAEAMARAVRELGVDIRTGTRVRHIDVIDDRTHGIVLTNGERIGSNLVVSAVNPRTTLLGLVESHHLDTGMVRRARSIRMRGNAAKLHLALKDKPDFKGADLLSRLVIAPSVRAVEDAFNPVKYGDCSQEPVMEIVLPSAFETGFAPPGQHILSAIVQFAPYDLREGWERGKPAFMVRIMNRLEAYAPGIGALVVGSELLTPRDLEREYGFVGGNWHHGELAVEQMFFLRPMIGAAQYKLPIEGLYLAGAGCHPGGGISGAAGWNAAERIIMQEGR